MADERIALRVAEEAGPWRRPLTTGVPLPKGAVSDPGQLWLMDPDGAVAISQIRGLSRWPDESLKWVLVDFQGGGGQTGEGQTREGQTGEGQTGGQVTYELCYGAEAPAGPVDTGLSVVSSDEEIEVCTGALRFAIRRDEFALFDRVELGRMAGGAFAVEQEVVPRGEGGESWVRICESRSDGATGRRIYGMGGKCLASLAKDGFEVDVEEVGPLRVVIRCRGAYEAEAPMHHYAGYRPLHFTTRIYAYAGQAFVRVVHSVVVTCNPRETEVEEIALRVPVRLHGPLRYRMGGRGGEGSGLAPEEYLMLQQVADNHYTVEQQSLGRQQRLAEGARCEGWIAAEDGEVGVGVALRYMAEEFPKALGVSGNGRGLEVYLWSDAAGERLSFKRYSEEVAWHEGEGVYADGTGTAKTSEFFISYYRREGAAEATAQLRSLLAMPPVSVDPRWMARCAVTGGFAPAEASGFPAAERMMEGFADWLARSIEQEGWYGYLDWGDVLATWEEGGDSWRFRGRWGWCNSEWDPRHGMWIQYLRTGERRYFRLAEAMTRHSVDVDTCHFNPFRPYMVGGCFRHSVDHFGDEPCASHTFIDNWVDYYYLTGDLRTLEVLRETGDFLLRYRWSEDPRYSFSLRSIANVLRGLLYLFEITGEEKFWRRAQEVYEVIARAQNEDGSWHKRFQVSTEDLQPDQAPYGMASEGTTLAVEMGTAAPFTENEYRELWPHLARAPRVLPAVEQKGYQTHYLMIGLELMQRMSGRRDVAEVYQRAVDWFCGGPGQFDAEFALKEHYNGVLCRHLGRAYQLSGERRYLEVGQRILQSLIEAQDWSDDPRKRGAVAMNPTAFSLLFFGVPLLLGALKEATMEELPS